MSGGTIHILGASGRTGRTLCRLAQAAGLTPVPVVRDAGKWAAAALPFPPRVADLADRPALTAALRDAAVIVNVSHAVWTENILATAPALARVVITGTARIYGRGTDAPAEAARRAEAALRASGRDAAILHPTMIYGDAEDGTVSRIAAALRRTPVLPLPGGGRAKVQPVLRADLARALLAAAGRRWTAPVSVPLGGPSPLPYADLVRAVAAAMGRRVRIVPVPGFAVRLLGREGLMRQLEDRTVPEPGGWDLLGVRALPLVEGLRGMFKEGTEGVLF